MLRRCRERSMLQLATHYQPKEPHAMPYLDDLSDALASLHERVAPSVVGIGSRLRGSGVVVADGQILTNAHNLRGEEVTVTFPGGRTTVGRVAGVDVDGDLAVVAA